MKLYKRIGVLLLLTITFINISCSRKQDPRHDERFLTYIVNNQKEELKFYWKNDRNERLGSILHLKSWLDTNKHSLLFAMNGGMYRPDHSPQGLFIENKKTIIATDAFSGEGNFYLKHNGVFYITTKNKGGICKTTLFQNKGDISYATQSGPMLVIDGVIHPQFKKGSLSLNIRNGVGILPDNRIVFVLSKKEINFYDFAEYFKNMGCENALYLDGFVSRAYLPEQNWIQTDGDFGVIIGATSKSQ